MVFDASPTVFRRVFVASNKNGDGDTRQNEDRKPKLAPDGQTILIPQPADDCNDPLNWSWLRKHAILLCVSFGAFAGDFGMSIGIPATVLQGAEWHISTSTINEPNSLAVVMIGISSLVWIPLLNCWGRAPVLFWSTVLGLFFTLGCILAPTFPVYYAMRALQALTQGTGSSIGLALIQDMFFFHQYARKIGLWYAVFLISPFLGPMLGNFMVAGLGKWRPLFWLVFAWAAGLTAMILAVGDETYYRRDMPLGRQPRRSGSRLWRVVGGWQLRVHKDYFESVRSSYARMFSILLRPVVTVLSLVYGLLFMWSIGINQTSTILLGVSRETGGYGMSAQQIGYMYFSPVLSVCLGELVGHRLNDFIVTWYARRHQGRFVPETRLWATYLGGFFMVPGLVLVGITLQQHLHWVCILFGWAMFQGGVMVVSVSMVAYVLDSYPSVPGEVSGWINMSRAACGFAIGYFQQVWGLKEGYGLSFGLQAVICLAAFGLVVCIHVFGQRLRLLSEPQQNNI